MHSAAKPHFTFGDVHASTVRGRRGVGRWDLRTPNYI